MSHAIDTAFRIAQGHHQAGRLGEAEALYREILQAEPHHPDALHLLGVLSSQTGKPEVALDLIGKAISLAPGHPAYHNNLGNILMTQGRFEQACISFQQAVALKPDYALAHSNLGNALGELNRFDEAIACFIEALKIQPGYAEAYSNLGVALQRQDRLDEAVASYRQALKLRPDLAEAYCFLGATLQAQHKLDEAMDCYRQSLALKPDLAKGHFNLGTLLHVLGKTEQAIDSYRQAMVCNPDYLEAHSNLIFTLNYTHHYSASRCFDEARLFGQNASRQARAPFSQWLCTPQPERLRIGLVSGDLRNHAVGHFLEGVLAAVSVSALNSPRLEIIAYPTLYVAQDDRLTSRLRSCVTAWEPLTGLNDEAASRLIHDDGIHVLLDLSGHSAHNRLPLFAWKPAPIQVSWLGYFATTGLAEMDYVLADSCVAPPEEAAQFTEKIWRLPDSYICLTPPEFPVDVNPLPALATSVLTFGCFNNLAKMNDKVVALWSRVLQAVPGSRLFLKTNPLDHVQIGEATRQRFAVHGIAPERLLLEGHSPRAELLAAYHRVDIALDPFPYPGGTSSAESLWMGVPVITRRGDRFLSHVGESIAQSAGMSDWIACDDDDYVAKAVEKAGNLEALAQVRAGLRQQVLASPLFDAARFARNFEAALWGMWQSHTECHLAKPSDRINDEA